MYEENIKRIEAEIRSFEAHMKSLNAAIETTKEILNEIRAGLSSVSAAANASGRPFSSEERQLYLDDIKRCHDDIAAMFGAGFEMKKNRDQLKVNLEILRKRNV